MLVQLCLRLLGHAACTGHAGIHTIPSKVMQSLKDCALIFFLISTGEESNQPTKHSNKITITIFYYEAHIP